MLILKYIVWWEIRRQLLNLILAVVTLLLLLTLKINIISVEMGSGEYFIFLFYVALVIAANLLYTLMYISYYRKLLKNGKHKLLFKRFALTTIIVFVICTIFFLLLFLGIFQILFN